MPATSSATSFDTTSRKGWTRSIGWHVLAAYVTRATTAGSLSPCSRRTRPVRPRAFGNRVCRFRAAGPASRGRARFGLEPRRKAAARRKSSVGVAILGIGNAQFPCPRARGCGPQPPRRRANRPLCTLAKAPRFPAWSQGTVRSSWTKRPGRGGSPVLGPGEMTLHDTRYPGPSPGLNCDAPSGLPINACRPHRFSSMKLGKGPRALIGSPEGAIQFSPGLRPRVRVS